MYCSASRDQQLTQNLLKDTRVHQRLFSLFINWTTPAELLSDSLPREQICGPQKFILSLF